jgi:polyhydroxybutyrate depolymerase
MIHIYAMNNVAMSSSRSRGGVFAEVAALVVLATVVPSPLAPAVSAEPAGDLSHGAVTVDGRERTYRLYVPSSVQDGAAPLFIGLHGGGGWGDQFARTNHVEAVAERNGFIVVHPDGVNIPGQRGGVWNGGMCCAIAARENVDDVEFVNVLIDEVAGTHDIDPRRVFAFGHSNGGIMSYRLACELADRIVGIGVVAGTLGVDACGPSQPVSVIHVHGTADRNVPIAGGVGPDSRAGVDFPPPLDGFATLAGRAGCPAAEETTAGDITTALREPCDAASGAAFVTIESAAHPWPGGTPAVPPASGAVYEDYDATAEIVDFLLSHPRP